MTRHHHFSVGMAAILAVIFTFPSFGQLDNRVNRGNMSSGRALDANFAIGAGRTVPNQNRYIPGRWSEAIVTGNISGLGNLHVPVSALGTNSFRLSLPSAGLSSFERRSVDLSTIGASSSGRPVFYYGAAETIADLGQIQRGLNMPGSSRLSTPYVPPSAPLLSHRISTDMGTSIRPIDLGSSLAVPTPDLGMSQRSLSGEASPRTVEEALRPYTFAADSTLFGPSTPTMPIPSINDNPALRSTLEQIRADREARSITERQERADKLRRDGAGLPELAGRPYDPSALTQPEIDPLGIADRTMTGEMAPLDSPGELSRQQGMTQRPLSSEAIAAADAATKHPAGDLGADIFADLTKSLATAQALDLGDLGYQAPAAGTGGSEATSSGAATTETGESEMAFEPGGTDRVALKRRSTENMTKLAEAAKWAETRLQEPLTTFVGTNQSKLNRYMAVGETALKTGEYYKAALQFDLACTVDRDNPLPWLARGHALVAAGDYISAVVCLERGIERFPQIAAFRLDLPALVDQHDIFDVRRADLETRLSAGDSYELRFLLGYLELYSGLPESGLRDLRLAANSAPAGSVIAIFPDLVLGQRELPPLGRSLPSTSK